MAGETMNPAECGLKEQMQKRYVDINPAIEFLEGYDNSWGQEFADGVRTALHFIKKLPAADVQEVKHAQEKCKHYKEREYERYTTAFEKGMAYARTGIIPQTIRAVEGRCWGTKDAERCTCGGDESKCDFYPDVRKNARKELARKATEETKTAEPKFGEWISVKDKLPKNYDLVLIAFAPSKNEARKGLIVNTGYINSDGNWFEYHSPLPICRWKNITHWQPLPEPPKEGESK